ncbi:uncharacterized protein N7498_001243 [Penicillium cinerascens]|uniref:Yeast cell wall synthesis Kre9/Knh1-like N-terminal domain-containing protein n=1 Tax=Penicillium cinerascens TaxID=70096 RepID=A0A9W9NI75_9EURO|nr:uncharacterized protein N7498_001243 [Penicillium cinerascens]KAJ5219144.1 hypothetical protein N7498_001243 [Penicillium cinerascens]
MRFTTAAVFSTLAAFAAAYTEPNYKLPPSGNPISSPGLNEQVPEGAPFTIKWDPTLGKTVSLVLLRGPSTNVVPLETIVEDIPNSGSYTWTPGTNLQVDNTHYGLLLVVEGTGAYQWSTQFGIAAPAGGHVSASRTDDKTTAAPTSTPSGTVIVTDDITTTYCPEEESSSASKAAATTPASVPVSSSSTVWATYEVTTTICPETDSPVSSGVVPTGTASATPSSTPVFNGAGRNAMSLGAIAAGVFAVLAL